MCRRLYQRLSGHFCRDIQMHQLQDGRRYVAQASAVFQLLRLVGNVEQRYIVEGVSRYRITVFIQHHIGIAVICCQQDLTVLCQDGVYDLRYALVQGFDGFFAASMTPV